jgi:3-oxoacyl-[acyl-carrier-protein] synthase II
MRARLTSVALRTPLGNDPESFTRRLLAGERAAREHATLPADAPTCRLSAGIAGSPSARSHRRFLRRIELFAVDVGVEAYEAVAGHAVAGERCGLFTATSGLRPDWDELSAVLVREPPGTGSPWQRGLGELHPFWLLRHLSNNVHALLGAELGAHGEGGTFGGGNAGAQALAAALRALEAGTIDVAVVVACDDGATPEALVDGARRGEFTTRALDALTAPYDAGAEGGVPGEAAVALVLEPLSSGSVPTQALVDALATGDGQPGYPRADSLAGAVRRFRAARPAGPLLVDGAARARPELDLEERVALADAVGADALLGATAAATGRLGAATSLLQVVALARLLAAGVVAPVAGLSRPPPGPLRPVDRVESHSLRSALGVALSAPGLIGLVEVCRP